MTLDPQAQAQLDLNTGRANAATAEWSVRPQRPFPALADVHDEKAGRSLLSRLCRGDRKGDRADLWGRVGRCGVSQEAPPRVGQLALVQIGTPQEVIEFDM